MRFRHKPKANRLGTKETVQKRSIGTNSKIRKRCNIEQKTANGAAVN